MEDGIKPHVVLVILFSVNLAICTPVQILTPCQVNDKECMTKSANFLLPEILVGNPALGIPSAEPLFVSEIEGNLSGLKFTLTNASTQGYSKCKISNVRYDVDKMVLSYDSLCKNLHITGQYSINGRLIVLPVEGNGDFGIHGKEFYLKIKFDVQKVQGKDGRTHLNIKAFKVIAEATKQVTYNFSNLFNGNKELADTVLKFANDNWKEVVDFVQEPVIIGNVKTIVKTLNKYFKTVPYEDLFTE